MSFHDLLVHRVYVEKSADIPMGLSLYVTCLFSFSAFGIRSLFCMLSFFIMICLGGFFFGPDGLVFCKPPVAGCSLSPGWGSFQLLHFVE
jgi:hypothetical protein